MTVLSGIYLDPRGDALAGIEIQFISTANTANTVRLADAIVTTAKDGAYLVDISPGVYNVAAIHNNRRTPLGPIEIFADSMPGTLNDYLMRFDPRARSPEIVRQLEQLVEEARYLAANASGPKGDKGDEGEKGETGTTGMSAYELALGDGYIGDETEWLASLKGEKGDQGVPAYGVTPKTVVADVAALPTTGQTIGDAYWVGPDREFTVWIGTKWENLGSIIGAKGEKGDTGEEGLSAFEVAKAAGFIGDENAWLASLKVKGDTGDKGDEGESAYDVAVAGGFVGTPADWLLTLKGEKGEKGETGEIGLSAYEFAKAYGFIGDENDWLASLHGKDGDDGKKGDTGQSAFEAAKAAGFTGTQGEWIVSLKGVNGKSAFEIALDEGFSGTDIQWLASLKGVKGDIGVDGKSAYEVAVAGGYKGTPVQWLASLKGEKGDKGLSAYEVAKAGGYSDTEAAWLDSLKVKGDKGDKGEKGEKGDPGLPPSNVITTDSMQTITGAKVFAGRVTMSGRSTVEMALATSVTVPTPSTSTQAANKGYVDAVVSAMAPVDMVTLTDDQEITGKKTFKGGAILPDAPTKDTDAANKAYVDLTVQTARDGAVNDVNADFVKMQASIDTKVDKTLYASDKATFALKTELADKYGKTETAKAIADAITAMKLPANLATTDAAQSFTAIQTFKESVYFNGAVVVRSGVNVNMSAANAVTVPTPNDDDEAANKAYVDGEVAKIQTSFADHAILDADQEFTGENTFSGDVIVSDTANINLTKAKSVLVATPTENGNPATKGYVDTEIANKISGATNPGNPLANFATLDTAQTFTGDKEFTGALNVATPTADTNAATKKYVDGSVTAAMANAILTTGNQTADGIKTFLKSPVVPDPTTDGQAANRKFVVSTVNAAISGSVVTLDSQQRITANKNYSGTQDFEGAVIFEGAVSTTSASTIDLSLAQSIVVPYPSDDANPATRKYVTDQTAAMVTTNTTQNITGEKTFMGGMILPYDQSLKVIDSAGASHDAFRLGSSGLTIGDSSQTITLLGSAALVGGLTASDSTATINLVNAGSVRVPEPSSDNSAATRLYVDRQIVASANIAPTNMVTTDTDQAVGGTKNFTGRVSMVGAVDMSRSTSVLVPTTPTANGQAASKKYVDDQITLLNASPVFVSLTADQEIHGQKSFAEVVTFIEGMTADATATVDLSKATSVTVPAPKADGEAVNRKAMTDALAAYVPATPAKMVATDGDQSIAGVKTFTGTVKLSNAPKANTDAVNLAAMTAAIAAAPVVSLTGDQDVAGVKSFTDGVSAPAGAVIDFKEADSVSVPAPIDGDSAVRKSDLDAAIAGVSVTVPTNMITTDGTETITGGKTFSATQKFTGIIALSGQLNALAGGRVDLTSSDRVYVPTPADGRGAAPKSYVDDMVNNAPYIKTTGNQSIGGSKTFTGKVLLSSGTYILGVADDGSNDPLISYIDQSAWSSNGRVLTIGGTGVDSITIASQSSFNDKVINGVGTPTNPTDAANKAYVDDKVSGFVSSIYSQSVGGAKTFRDGILVPETPTDSASATAKSYVDAAVKAGGFKVDYVKTITNVNNLNTASQGYLAQGKFLSGCPSQVMDNDWVLLKVFRNPDDATIVTQELIDFTRARRWYRWSNIGAWDNWREPSVSAGTAMLSELGGQTFAGKVAFDKPIEGSLQWLRNYLTPYDLIRGGDMPFVGKTTPSLPTTIIGDLSSNTIINGGNIGVNGPLTVAGALSVLGSIPVGSTSAPKLDISFSGKDATIDNPTGGITLSTSGYVKVPSITSVSDDNAAVNKKYLTDLLAGVVDTSTPQTIGGNKTFTGTTKFNGTLQVVNSAVFMGGASSVSVPSPTLTTHAATKGYVDDALANGVVTTSTAQTITGQKVFSGVNGGIKLDDGVHLTIGSGLAHITNVDGVGIDFWSPDLILLSAPHVQVPTPVDPTDAATKAYVDSVLAKAVTTDTTQTISANKSFNGFIQFGQSPQAPDPTASRDIATKGYVDSKVGTGGGSSTAPSNMVTTDTQQTIDGLKTFRGGLAIVANGKISTNTGLTLLSSDGYKVSVGSDTSLTTLLGQTTIPRTPTSPYDVANKEYVDSKAGGGSGLPFHNETTGTGWDLFTVGAGVYCGNKYRFSNGPTDWTSSLNASHELQVTVTTVGTTDYAAITAVVSNPNGASTIYVGTRNTGGVYTFIGWTKFSGNVVT
ncbi:prophage tail fiber N-terminal domain-containing protein [Escherichia coli]|nr:prophage tail fiber N-terminal domain-containing protein [Escherichia coli]